MNEVVQRSGKATASLVLGIFSFCLTFLTGIPAIILGILALMDISKSDGKSRGEGLAIAGIVTGTVGGFICFPILLALLLPAVQAARGAAWKAQCASKMKGIGAAIQQYESVHGVLPPAVTKDDNGVPMHSWRTLILPYLDHIDVYEDYDFTGAWNGPANSALAQAHSDIYACPASDDVTEATTSYVVVTGPGFVFDADRTVSSNDVAGGLAHTIAVVDMGNSGIKWTEPRDLPYEEFLAHLQNGPLNHRAGFNAVLLDGSVVFLDEEIDRHVLRALFTLADDLDLSNTQQ